MAQSKLTLTLLKEKDPNQEQSLIEDTCGNLYLVEQENLGNSKRQTAYQPLKILLSSASHLSPGKRVERIEVIYKDRS